MCADGRKDVPRPRGDAVRRWPMPRTSAITLLWVIWTAFGGPVVPDV